MMIDRTASAGSLESSDAMVTVGPHPDGIEISVTSPAVRIDDRGALDCTLRARIETAVGRGIAPR